MYHLDIQQAIRNNTGIPNNNATLTERDLQMGEPNWVNRTIWTGDNLHVLRGMNSKSVDLIYLDPPFNSNRNYAAPIGSKAAGAAFKDTWHLSDLDVAWMGLIADTEPALYRVVETAGLAHGKHTQSYLCMMAVRLIEMKRVLKDTGTIYLHCDPTASHYLKTLMDVIFDPRNFLNEITWTYRKWTNAATHFQRNHDILLMYAGSKGQHLFNKLTDPDAPQKSKYARGWDTNVVKGGIRQLIVYDRVLAAEKIKSEKYDRVVYREDGQKVALPDHWQISIVNSQSKEYTGFRTQKPVSLLERVIKASSNVGDVVLDPFCGCATACVAAETHGRQWAGIDLSEKAVELVGHRLRDHHGLFGQIIHRTDIPKQEGVLDVMYKNRETKHILFGEQEGQCNGCKYSFDYRHFEVDHIVPQSRGGGGGDHIGNLQLLCGHCNKIKGARPMEYLVARLNENEFLSTRTAHS